MYIIGDVKTRSFHQMSKDLSKIKGDSAKTFFYIKKLYFGYGI